MPRVAKADVTATKVSSPDELPLVVPLAEFDAPPFDPFARLDCCEVVEDPGDVVPVPDELPFEILEPFFGDGWFEADGFPELLDDPMTRIGLNVDGQMEPGFTGTAPTGENVRVFVHQNSKRGSEDAGIRLRIVRSN